MNQKCPYCGLNIDITDRFSNTLAYLKEAKNKPAFLVNALMTWHDITEEESKTVFDRLSGIIKHAHNDYAYLLKVIWDTASVGIVGSHLNYIDAVICKKQNNNKFDVSKPPKYKSIQEVLDLEEKRYGSR